VASLFVCKILTISKDTKQDLVRGGLSVHKITHLYIGIDTSAFKPLSNVQIQILRSRLHIRPKAFVVGFLGTVTNEKGIEDFVEVSRQLLQKTTNYHFIVIGDGPYYSWLQETVKRFNIEQNYTCPGFLEDVRKYLGSIDILFLPTRHFEGLPLAILEAESMGKVVVTSRMGGNPEIIKNGVNGFLYRQFDITVISKRIEDLYANKSKMAELKRQARENIIDRFNIKIQAKKFIQFLQTL
jgi:glycosyltransferase involved in cell wall biosynthesis